MKTPPKPSEPVALLRVAGEAIQAAQAPVERQVVAREGDALGLTPAKLASKTGSLSVSYGFAMGVLLVSCGFSMVSYELSLNSYGVSMVCPLFLGKQPGGEGGGWNLVTTCSNNQTLVWKGGNATVGLNHDLIF